MGRRALATGATAAVVLLEAAAAHAGLLYSATWLQVTQGVPMTRTTAQLGAEGFSSASSIGVSLTYPAFSTAFFAPKTPNGLFDLHIKITQGGSQNLTATPGMGGATIGIEGAAIVRTALHIGTGTKPSMYEAGVHALVYIPLRHGRAGQLTGYFIALGHYHNITVDSFGWTPGTLTFTGLTSMSIALPDVVAMGSFNLTGTGAGTVSLVSPTKISINGAISQRRTASFSTLKLTFVPEASALLLLGAAGLALAIVRRK